MLDGTIYVGDFSEGKKIGFGQFEWTDGSKYEGEVKYSQFEGKGNQ